MKTAVGVLSLSKELNTVNIIRTANHFGIQRVFVIGKKLLATKTCMHCHKNMIIKYFNTEQEFVEYVWENGYKLVLIEKTDTSVNIANYTFPDNIVIMSGHENLGFSDYLKSCATDIVHIPCVGVVNYLNTSNAFAIGMYKYFEQQVLQ